MNIYLLFIKPFHSMFKVKKVVQWSTLNAHSESLQARAMGHSFLAAN